MIMANSVLSFPPLQHIRPQSKSQRLTRSNEPTGKHSLIIQYATTVCTAINKQETYKFNSAFKSSHDQHIPSFRVVSVRGAATIKPGQTQTQARPRPRPAHIHTCTILSRTSHYHPHILISEADATVHTREGARSRSAAGLAKVQLKFGLRHA